MADPGAMPMLAPAFGRCFCNDAAAWLDAFDPMKTADLMPFAKTLKAFRFLFVGPCILVLLAVINAMTTPGHWWVKWPALGIGIAWAVSLIRVLKAMVVLGGVAALVAYLRRR